MTTSVSRSASSSCAGSCSWYTEPEVVLLDIAMPDRGGYDVAGELSREYGSACPVLVALSGHCDAADRARADSSGFHHFIPKPYDPATLLALIDQLGRKPGLGKANGPLA